MLKNDLWISKQASLGMLEPFQEPYTGAVPSLTYKGQRYPVRAARGELSEHLEDEGIQ